MQLLTNGSRWHIHHGDREAFAADIGDFKGTWDGHTTAQKFERLHALLNRPEESAGGST